MIRQAQKRAGEHFVPMVVHVLANIVPFVVFNRNRIGTVLLRVVLLEIVIRLQLLHRRHIVLRAFDRRIAREIDDFRAHIRFFLSHFGMHAPAERLRRLGERVARIDANAANKIFTVRVMQSRTDAARHQRERAFRFHRRHQERTRRAEFVRVFIRRRANRVMQFPHQFDLLLPIVAERAHRVLPARHRAAEQTVALMSLVPIMQFEIHAGHAVARARA